MAQSYFAAIPPIRFEGAGSENPFAYRYYDKDRIVLGKRMEDHLRMAVRRSCPNGARRTVCISAYPRLLSYRNLTRRSSYFVARDGQGLQRPSQPPQ